MREADADAGYNVGARDEAQDAATRGADIANATFFQHVLAAAGDPIAFAAAPAAQVQSPAEAGQPESLGLSLAAFAVALQAAAAAGALPEPLLWSLRSVAAVAAVLGAREERAAASRAPPSPPPRLLLPPDDVTAAVSCLAAACVERAPSGLGACLAGVERFLRALLSRDTCVACGVAGFAADAWPLSLAATVSHYAIKAPRPPRGVFGAASAPSPDAHSAPSSAQLDRASPLFTLSASKLGRYIALRSCARYIHLKSEERPPASFRGGFGSAPGVTGATGEAVLGGASVSAAILAKGLDWEARLNETHLANGAPFPRTLCRLDAAGAGDAPAGDLCVTIEVRARIYRM